MLEMDTYKAASERVQIPNLITTHKSGEVITAVVEFRPAREQDFFHETKVNGQWKKVRNVGMQFFLLNISDQLECYRLKEDSNANEIKKFIDAGRCLLLKEVTV